MSATAEEIAQWMMEKVEKGDMYQEEVVDEIFSRFGKEFTYENDNGNLAIRKDILQAFRKLSENSVVWERGERYWRKRNKFDSPGRQQEP